MVFSSLSAEVAEAILSHLRPPTETDRGETGGTMMKLLDLGKNSVAASPWPPVHRSFLF
jgi:hypothetical protein